MHFGDKLRFFLKFSSFYSQVLIIISTFALSLLTYVVGVAGRSSGSQRLFYVLRLTANQGDSMALELRTTQISVDYYGIKKLLTDGWCRNEEQMFFIVVLSCNEFDDKCSGF